MAKAKPNPDTSAMAKNLAGKILVENWTKWRLFVNSSLAKDPQVIFGNTVSAVDLPSDKVQFKAASMRSCCENVQLERISCDKRNQSQIFNFIWALFLPATFSNEYS